MRPVFILVFLCFCFFYGVHSESCRGLTVLTSSSGTIEDHSGPGNYSHDVFCQWLITTNDTNERITLRFNRFDLKSDPTNGDFDYLNINDGDSFASPALVWFTSNELPKPVQSSGKSLFLTFQSSSRGWTGRGFSLEYSITSCINHCGNHGYCFNGYCHCDGGWRGIACGEAFCEEDCGSKKGYGKCDKNNNVCVCKEGYYGGNCLDAFCDRLSYLTSKSGTFTDHHKEISGNNYYLHNANCSWLISVPDAEFIKVSFTYFDVEEYWDYVTIFQGNNHNGLVLGNYSGKNIPPSVTAHGNQVFINFVTDVGLSAGGFVAQYTSGKLSEVGFSGGAVLAVGFLCLLLGAGFGVGAMFLWERYKDRKEGAQYHPVPFDDQEDLVDSERN